MKNIFCICLYMSTFRQNFPFLCCEVKKISDAVTLNHFGKYYICPNFLQIF